MAKILDLKIDLLKCIGVTLKYSTLSNTRNGFNKHNGVQKLNLIMFEMDAISRTAFKTVIQ